MSMNTNTLMKDTDLKVGDIVAFDNTNATKLKDYLAALQAWYDDKKLSWIKLYRLKQVLMRGRDLEIVEVDGNPPFYRVKLLGYQLSFPFVFNAEDFK